MNRGILEEFFLCFDLVWLVEIKYDLAKLKKGFWRFFFCMNVERNGPRRGRGREHVQADVEGCGALN